MTAVYFAQGGWREANGVIFSAFYKDDPVQTYFASEHGSSTGNPAHAAEEMRTYLALGRDLSARRAGEATPFLNDRTLRLLFSFFYFNDIDVGSLLCERFAGLDVKVFADSGAFSGSMQGLDVSLDDYVAWLHANAEHLEAYAALDIIGNAEQTKANQAEMERQGLTPLPVFHVGSDWKHLEAMIERYEYIALGGMVPWVKARAKLGAWIKRCFAKGKATTRFHGFGMTTWALVRAFPWASVDSSSWVSPFKFGMLNLFDPRCGRFVKIQIGRETVFRHADLFGLYGFSPADFIGCDPPRGKVAAISLLSYMTAGEWSPPRGER